MGYTNYNVNGRNFLVNEDYHTRNYTFSSTYAGAVTVDGRTIIKAGSPVPANDATAVGIAFHDIDITYGNATGSLMYAGFVYSDKLPVTLASTAVTALNTLGLHFQVSPVNTMPVDGTLE